MADGMKRAADAARATRGLPPRHTITAAKAARLARAITDISACTDCPDSLQVALDDARAEIDSYLGSDQ